MGKATLLLVLLALCPGGDGLLRFMYRNIQVSVPHGEDAGQPLFLTPYIEAGNLMQGRKLSAVAPFQGLHLGSYMGFLTVNKTYNSNLFFWFTPAEIDPETAPVVLWLQGGPGASSLFGLFVEHGPYIVAKDLTLRHREFPWTSTLSMLYIDNPVGAGFSFTDDPRGYAASEDDVARDLLSALIQFFQLFPELQENDFYASGQSYAGKYVPAIAHYIHTANPVLKVKINLKGIAIGAGLSDPESMIGGYATFLYQVGLLDEKQRNYVQKQCNETLRHIKEEAWLQAYEVMDKLMDGDPSYLESVTGCSSYYNLLQCTEPEDYSYFGKFLSLPDVRRLLHVGNRTFHNGSDVEKHMREDILQSVAPWLAEIMNNYKVLIYNGQLDSLVAASMTERHLMAMNWKGSQEYKKAERKVWKMFKSDDEVAGYVRQVGNFSQVIVRGGGHILPYDQPLRAFDMINRFIYDKGWDPY